VVAGTRQRMIEATMRLLQRNGYAATSWRGVVEEAGTPWGSAHHYFPGGKEQLTAAAVQLGSDLVVAALEESLERRDSVAEAVQGWFAASAKNLKQSRYRGGCPIATVALETTPGSNALTAVCQASFRQWESLLASRLRQAGVTPPRARELATLVVANLEGALLLARVSQDTRPITVAAEAMAHLIESETAVLDPGASRPLPRCV
jgi:TetR/AcrR family transcriptional repressor of lmrAB and yxaGH operons